MSATDPEGDTLSFSITAQYTKADDGTLTQITSNFPFAIDTATGAITLTQYGALNFEAIKTYQLMVSASATGGSDSAAITLHVTDVNEVPSVTAATRSVFVGEPDETPVGSSLSATDPDGDTLTWSIVASTVPANLPFEIDSNTGQISVEITSALRKLDTEYEQTVGATKGEYKFDVEVNDGQDHTDSATVTIMLVQVKTMSGVTIRMRGKSDKSTTAVAEYILQGGSGGGAGLVGGMVEAAADELLKNANEGDVVLLTTGNGSDLWADLWTRRSSVTPLVNSVVSLEFDYSGGLTAAKAAAIDPTVTRYIANSEALFFQGGDQAEYLAVWRSTNPNSVQAKVQAKVGVVTIGGTSAGMHILSSTIYESPLDGDGVGSDSAVETPYGPRMVMGSAFLNIPLFSQTVFDTHFWQRNRMGRTLAFLARMQLDCCVDGRGIAADENTALIITTAGVARVLATAGSNRNVYIFDTSLAFYGSDPPLPSVIYTGIITYKLSAGEQFNLNTWQPIGAPTEKYWVDVDYYQPWFVQGRNWATNAIESRYGGTTPLVGIGQRILWEAER